MNKKLNKCSWIIHLFAIAHGFAAWLMAHLGYADDILLSLLTISMIVLVTHTFGFPLEVSAAFAALCCFAGFYLGTVGGNLLKGAEMPFVIEYANAITTFLVSEILGWITVFIAKRR